MPGDQSSQPSAGPSNQGATRQGSKALFQEWSQEVVHAKERGRSVAHCALGCHIPELLGAFDIVSIVYELNATQLAAKKLAGKYISLAEDQGYPLDSCSYGKCHVGLQQSGMEHPIFGKLPTPDMAIGATRCACHVNLAEVSRSQYGIPSLVVDLPNNRVMQRATTEEEYQADKRYVLAQLEAIKEVCEKVTGKKFDPDKMSELIDRTDKGALLYCRFVELNRHRPAPYDMLLEGLNLMAITNSPLRGTKLWLSVMENAVKEMEERVRLGISPVPNEAFRLVFDGVPCYSQMSTFTKLFHKWNTVFPYACYVSMVGGFGQWETGFRSDPARPLESLAEMLVANRRPGMLDPYSDKLYHVLRGVEEYHCDGVVLHSVKSCRPESTALADVREALMHDHHIPTVLLESDLVDARYFSEAQMKQRVDAFLESMGQRSERRAKGAGR